MLNLRKRVIPVLLLNGEGLVKTVGFKKQVYVGDAINTVRIFNEKEVDELVLIDITPLSKRCEPNYRLLNDITTECFSPLAYGGKISNIDQIRRVLKLGFEKIVINTAAINNPSFLTEATKVFGSSTIIGSIDVKKTFLRGPMVYTAYGTMNTLRTPLEIAQMFEKCGVGEILLNSIDRDGKQVGYDLELIRSLSTGIKLPLIACGGAKDIGDFVRAFENGASAVAAGSKFVFNGKHNAVLITYLSEAENNILLNL